MWRGWFQSTEGNDAMSVKRAGMVTMSTDPWAYPSRWARLTKRARWATEDAARLVRWHWLACRLQCGPGDGVVACCHRTRCPGLAALAGRERHI